MESGCKSTLMGFFDWLLGQRMAYLNSLGEHVGKEWREARKEKCVGDPDNGVKECEYYGWVRPDGILPKERGCLACGCILEVKWGMSMMWRKKGREKEPLTAEEAAEVGLMIKIGKIDNDRYVKVKVNCSHPEGDMWADIDNLFSNI